MLARPMACLRDGGASGGERDEERGDVLPQRRVKRRIPADHMSTGSAAYGSARASWRSVCASVGIR